MSKYSKEIQDKMRKWVEKLFIERTYDDIDERMRYIDRVLVSEGVELTLFGVIRVSQEYENFTPPNCYIAPIETVYLECGFNHIMTYEQFIFAIPQIWYTTLFRLIKEWKAQYTETELAY